MGKNIGLSTVACQAIDEINNRKTGKFLGPEVITTLTAEKIAQISEMTFGDEYDDVQEGSAKPVAEKIRMENKIDNIDTPEDLIYFIENMKGNKINSKYQNYFEIHLMVYFKDISDSSFDKTIKILFDNIDDGYIQELLDSGDKVLNDTGEEFDIFNEEGNELLEEPNYSKHHYVNYLEWSQNRL